MNNIRLVLFCVFLPAIAFGGTLDGRWQTMQLIVDQVQSVEKIMTTDKVAVTIVGNTGGTIIAITKDGVPVQRGLKRFTFYLTQNLKDMVTNQQCFQAGMLAMSNTEKYVFSLSARQVNGWGTGMETGGELSAELTTDPGASVGCTVALRAAAF